MHMNRGCHPSAVPFAFFFCFSFMLKNGFFLNIPVVVDSTEVNVQCIICRIIDIFFIVSFITVQLLFGNEIYS